MIAFQRKRKILELLREDGSAKVSDLARIFEVSEVTIRQDLEKLEREGYIFKEYGGAYLRNIRSHVQNACLMHQVNMESKEQIAEKCLEFIQNGDIIILDSGTTTTEIAKKLKGYHSLTVITNALNIAILLGAEPGVDVIVTSGEFKPPTLSLTGQHTADFISGFHVNKLFLATAGISSDAGLTYPSISDLSVKKAMINSAQTTYLVADSSKIGTTAFATLGALTLVDYLITDSGIVEDQKQAFRESKVELIIAS